MKNIFDLFKAKKEAAESNEARSQQAWQSRAAGIAEIVRASVPVFKEYEAELRKRGIAAKFIPVGTTGLKLKIPMKLTFGVVGFEQDRFVAYIESDPAKSNGYVRNNYTGAVSPPSINAWSGTGPLREFLDRSIEIFLKRYDDGTIGSGEVGP
jgi:hypothetical protein